MDFTIWEFKSLNPGLPAVRDYVTSVITDIVRRYDVDGIHFDDYFYQQGITTEDANAFQNYSRGFTNLGDWRRDNVNLLVAQIYDSIQVIKPYVKFGISPPGMWKSGNPSGICGYYGYSDIYADGIHWLQSHTIDYLAPQLYHSIGSSINCGSTDYKLIMNWWSTHTYSRQLFIGLGAYRIADWSSSEVPNQIRLNRGNQNVSGGILFRTRFGITDNLKGFLDTLQTDLYKYPALVPTMNWKDTIKPNAPLNLAFGKIASAGRSGLIWDLPSTASDGDSASRYVVYHFNTPTPQQSDYDNAENIYNVEGNRESFPSSSSLSAPYYFSVTSLDRNYNESSPSNVVQITEPLTPILASPFNNEYNIKDTVELKWMYANGSSSYQIQIGTDSTFNGDILFSFSSVNDTMQLIAGMSGQTKYFWRAKSFNIAGESNFSEVFSFTTGFPVTPVLLDPPHKALDVSISPTLKWAKAATAETYRFQLTKSLTFNDQTIILDTTVS